MKHQQALESLYLLEDGIKQEIAALQERLHDIQDSIGVLLKEDAPIPVVAAPAVVTGYNTKWQWLKKVHYILSRMSEPATSVAIAVFARQYEPKLLLSESELVGRISGAIHTGLKAGAFIRTGRRGSYLYRASATHTFSKIK